MDDEPKADGLKHWAIVAFLVLSGVLAMAGVYGEGSSQTGALVVTIAVAEFFRRWPGRRSERDDGAESPDPQAGWKPSLPTVEAARNKVQRYRLLGLVAVIILCGLTAVTGVLGEHEPIILTSVIFGAIVLFSRRRP